MHRVLLIALFACSDPAPSTAPTPPPAPPVPAIDASQLAEAPTVEGPLVGPPPSAPAGRHKHGTWSNTQTGVGCFYFSGPDGRDTKLGSDIAIAIDGERATVTWSGVVFEGTLREDMLDVKRTGRYDFNGPWSTTERLRGPYREGRLDGRYTYEECEQGQSCPGSCKISARIVVD